MNELTLILSLYLILYLARIPGMWMMFEKTREQGWKSIIPFYNIYICLGIIDKSKYLLLLYIFPGTTHIIYLAICIYLSQSFGKGILFGLGLAFWPTAPIFYMILGAGKSDYQGSGGVV